VTHEEASHRGCGEGDSSRTHGLPDGHHDHELHGLRTHYALKQEIPRTIVRGISFVTKCPDPHVTQAGVSTQTGEKNFRDED